MQLISSSELDAVLERARGERWRELAILGPPWSDPGSTRVPAERTVHLRHPLGPQITKR